MSWLVNLIPGGPALSGAWSLATSKVGIAAIALLIGLIAGYNWSSDRNTIASLRSEILTLQTDISIARGAEELANKQVAEMSESHHSNQEKVNALLSDLARRAQERGACALSDADARQLRNIK